MEQATRQKKYDKFWYWMEPSINPYSNAIQMLLNQLTDEQLDEFLADMPTDENIVLQRLVGNFQNKEAAEAGSNDWQEVGVIGVDAGLCWVGDPCYCVTPDADEHPAKTWSEFCDKLQDGREVESGVMPFSYKLGHAGLGVAVSTGYGDGVYPVFIRKNAEGRVMAVMVNFGGDENEQRFKSLVEAAKE